MLKEGKLYIGKGENAVCLLPSMANRHGLIAGATGTGKTVTLKVMAESFSSCGVPVFLADIKGDLAGCVSSGTMSDDIRSRLETLGIAPSEFPFSWFPVRFFDVYGEKGHPIRTTISDMGADLFSRLLGLTEVQSGVLSIVFRAADDRGWLLTDLKDLRAMVSWVSDHSKELLNEYGNVSKQSTGAIQRALLRLEDAGGAFLFGEPAFSVRDWISNDEDGRGYISILHCEKLYQSPLLYSTFLLWMLSELFEELPEVGDLEKPKLVFFFDEAHLLFRDMPKALLQKIEQVVKLIRSKGVGVFFITQQPSDIPDTVLAQLGNRVQHALHAYTPSEQRAVHAAAQSFRVNPAFDTEEVLTILAKGEALVSFLDAEGRPSVTERAIILPPQSAFGTITDERRKSEIEASDLYGKYETAVDPESAYEIIRAEAERSAEEAEAQAKAAATEKEAKEQQKLAEKQAKEQEKKKAAAKKNSAANKILNSAVNSVGREIGRSLARGVLGTLKKVLK